MIGMVRAEIHSIKGKGGKRSTNLPRTKVASIPPKNNTPVTKLAEEGEKLFL